MNEINQKNLGTTSIFPEKDPSNNSKVSFFQLSS